MKTPDDLREVTCELCGERMWAYRLADHLDDEHQMAKEILNLLGDIDC